MKILFFVLFLSTLSSQNHFEQGKQLFQAKQYTEARKIFEKNLQVYPNHPQTQEYIADCWAHSQQWDQALGYYQTLKTNYPKQANYHYKYGGTLAMIAKKSNKLKALSLLSDIENSLLKAAILDPNHIPVRWALIQYYLELPAILGGSENKAQKYASELKPLSLVDYYLSKGHIEVYFKRYTTAEIYLKKAHQTGNSPTTYAKLLDLYQNKLKDSQKVQQLTTK